MAIPFYEPKTNETPNQQQLQQQLLLNASVQQNYDQVDGIGVPPTASPHSSSTTTASTFLTPPPSPNAPLGLIIDGATFLMTTTQTSTTSTTTAPPAASPTATSTPPPPSPQPPLPPSFEQQAMALKILAITMCKALKEYYQQTSSAKDAFTSQTVQILPNGDIQPLWK